MQFDSRTDPGGNSSGLCIGDFLLIIVAKDILCALYISFTRVDLSTPSSSPASYATLLKHLRNYEVEKYFFEKYFHIYFRTIESSNISSPTPF